VLQIDFGCTGMVRSKVVIFVGAPGSGKGTQSAWLSGQLGMGTLSTGDALRSEAKRRSPAGIALRRTLAAGVLVADSVVCEVVGTRLMREARTPGFPGLILDGFPRTVAQARYLDSILADLGMPGPAVIHLRVAKPKLLKRLTGRRHCAVCGAVYNLNSRPSLRGPRCEGDGGLLIERDDDREEVVLRRLDEFEAVSRPVIDYYRGGDFHELDGDRAFDSVSSDLMRILGAPAVMAAA
jgi:adenylate kinase